VVSDERVVAADVDAPHLCRLLPGRKAKIIVSPIGGQGFLFGRGTPQFSDEVLGLVGPANVLAVAACEKLDSLKGQPLRLDLDDQTVTRSFPFSVRVISGDGEPELYPVSVFQA